MKVYTFLTDGFETVEALAVIDILRRAGIEVETVSITGNEQVCSAQNITVKADTLFKAQPVCKEDVLFLPGGPGHKQYNECKPLLKLLEKHHAEGGRIAAICAAPSILGHLGIFLFASLLEIHLKCKSFHIILYFAVPIFNTS